MRPSFRFAEDIIGTRLTNGEAILGVVGFAAGRPASLDPAIPFVTVPMDLLVPGPCFEVWSSSEPVGTGTEGRIMFAATEGMLFGIIPPSDAQGGTLETRAYETYSHLFSVADETGFPNVIRVFNYIPDITGMEHATERYRHFNTGRHRAFDACRRPMRAAPAACALGTREGLPVVYFVAARTEGVAIENPRQVSAYHYPARYGRTSPSFSRGMTIRHGAGRDLYISGTASIIGHESRHIGDPAAQVSETVDNLRSLLAQCGDASSLENAAQLVLKAYVRRHCDVAIVQAALERLLPATAIMILQADICRPELLVEIEGFCHLPE